MSKNFPSAEFKTAVKALNVVLKEEKMSVIKIVTVKKEKVIESFTTSVLDFIDNDNVAALPENVIDFYNAYIVSDEDSESGDVVPEKSDPVAKTKKTKKEKKVKPVKEKKVKKEKVQKAPGIIILGIKAWMEDGATTKQEIMDHVQPSFPDRDITKTISHVYGIVRNIRPYPKK